MIYAVIDNRWKIDGFDESASLRVTFAEAKFNNIIQRGGTVSNNIRVQMTANNEVVLREIRNANSEAARVRKIYDVQVYENNLVIFQGSLRFEKVNKDITLRLFGGGASFFESISGVDVKSIDVVDLYHEYTAANVNSRRERELGEDYVYPNITDGSWSDRDPKPFTDFFPSVYVRDILVRHASQQGYVIQGVEDFNEALLFSSDKYQSLINAKAVMMQDTIRTIDDIGGVFGESRYPFEPVDDDKNIFTLNQPSSNPDFDYTDANFQVPFSVKVKYNITAEQVGGSGGGRLVINLDIFDPNISPNVQFDSNIIAEFTTSNEPKTFEGEVVIGLPDIGGLDAVSAKLSIRASAGPQGTDIKIYEDSTWEIVDTFIEIREGDVISPYDGLPDISVDDLFKYVAVKTNSLIIVDNKNKAIKFNPLNEVKEKINKAYIWDKYLADDTNVEFDFTEGDYAQRNILRYANFFSEEARFNNAERGEGVILSTDKTKPKERMIYEAPFEFSFRVTVEDGRYLYIPRKQGAGARIGVIIVNDEDIININGQGALDTNANAYPATFEGIEEKDYSQWFRIVNDFRLVRTSLLLPRDVILDIDFTRPVSLLGAYWYIRQVREYTINKRGETVVELIKLP